MTTKVRVEWVWSPIWRSSTARGVYGAQSLTATGGATQELSTPAPSFGVDSTGSQVMVGLARVTVISGAALLAWGSQPIAAEASGMRLQVGQYADLVISTGQLVAIVEAADPPSALPVTP